MENSPGTAAETVVTGSRDHVRIVPLFAPEVFAPTAEAKPVSAPHLSYRGGPLLSAVKVVTVYWGGAWSADTQLATTATDLDAFFDAVLTSELMDQLAEYGVPGTPIGHGTRSMRAVVSTPAPQAVLTDGEVQRMLQQELTTSALPAGDANTLYFVYLPPGTAVTQGGSRSCQGFCGYHSDIGGTIFYAVMPYPSCAGCTGGLPVFDALTSTSSHELCEAVTDPVAGQGWYDDAHGEIGDICAWKTRKIGKYLVQLEWSNTTNGCA